MPARRGGACQSYLKTARCVLLGIWVSKCSEIVGCVPLRRTTAAADMAADHLRQVFWCEGLGPHMASKQGLPAALDSNTKRADKPKASDHNPSGLSGRWVPKVVCSHHKAGLLLPTARTARQEAVQLPE